MPEDCNTLSEKLYKKCQADDKDAFVQLLHLARTRLTSFNAYIVAGCYFNGWGCVKNLSESVFWTAQSANLGNVNAMYNLAYCYLHGNGCKIDRMEAFNWYQKAAEKNHSDAMYDLSACYRSGIGCKKDMQRAFFWIKKAAEKGDSSAINYVAYCYQYGIGCEKNLSLALERYEESAALGNSDAMCNLAEFYRRRKDAKQELIWGKLAARHGDAEAMFHVAFSYFCGENCRCNKAVAIKWYKKAADAGHPAARFNLGRCYQRGDGVVQDLSQALYWWRVAAEQGFPPAIFTYQLFSSLPTDKAIMLDEPVAALKEAVDSLKELFDLPELCHFTTLETLESMLAANAPASSYHRADCIRLYHVNYMNDPEEGKSLLSEDHKTANKILRRFFTDDDFDDEGFGIYCAAFSAEKDQLDLWRAYGQDGAGFCLVIPGTAFQNYNDNMMLINPFRRIPSAITAQQNNTDIDQLSLYRIRYCSTEKRDALKRVTPILAQIDKTFKSWPPSEQQSVRALVRWILYDFLFLFKDSQYENEHEYRLLSAHSINDSKVQEDTRYPPRLYVKTRNFLFRQPGAKIIIGPKIKEPHVVKLYLEHLLAKGGLTGNVSVEYSKVKYR